MLSANEKFIYSKELCKQQRISERKSAGEDSAVALEKLAALLDRDGKTYGGNQCRNMAMTAREWANCV